MTWTTSSGRRITIAPADGWLTLGLVMLLCLSLAWSLDDAQLVIGNDGYTDFLTWVAIGGVLAGFIGPTVGWGRWKTFAIGSVFAALIAPIFVGAAASTTGGSIGMLFRFTASEAVLAWRDLIMDDQGFTVAVGHHLLILGLIVWGSSMFASYAAFGHRRPLNAVLLIGVLLVANMSLDDPPAASVSRPVHAGGPVPAHPLPYVRRAERLDPPPDRRPERAGQPVPPRRDRVHRGRGLRLPAADPGGGLGPARRRLDRRRRPGDRVVAVPAALPARVGDRPLDRAVVR